LQPEHNIRADTFEVERLLAAGKDQAAVAAARKFLQARRGNWDESGDSILWLGCLSAARLGKLEEMRAALVHAQLLPPVFDASQLRAWAGTGDEGRRRLEHLDAYGVCSFSARAEDAPRRDALRNALAALATSDEGKSGGRATLRDARLRNDRKQIAQLLSQEPPNASWYKLARAQVGGVADDPRVQEQIGRAKADEANAHAQLPAALAKAGLSMWPPPEAGAATAP
jgi:hypothetical protein